MNKLERSIPSSVDGLRTKTQASQAKLLRTAKALLQPQQKEAPVNPQEALVKGNAFFQQMEQEGETPNSEVLEQLGLSISQLSSTTSSNEQNPLLHQLTEIRDRIIVHAFENTLTEITETYHQTSESLESNESIINGINTMLFEEKVIPRVEKLRENGVFNLYADTFLDALRERLNLHHRNAFPDISTDEYVKRIKRTNGIIEACINLENIGEEILDITDLVYDTAPFIPKPTRDFTPNDQYLPILNMVAMEEAKQVAYSLQTKLLQLGVSEEINQKLSSIVKHHTSYSLAFPYESSSTRARIRGEYEINNRSRTFNIIEVAQRLSPATDFILKHEIFTSDAVIQAKQTVEKNYIKTAAFADKQTDAPIQLHNALLHFINNPDIVPAIALYLDPNTLYRNYPSFRKRTTSKASWYFNTLPENVLKEALDKDTSGSLQQIVSMYQKNELNLEFLLAIGNNKPLTESQQAQYTALTTFATARLKAGDWHEKIYALDALVFLHPTLDDTWEYIYDVITHIPPGDTDAYAFATYAVMHAIPRLALNADRRPYYILAEIFQHTEDAQWQESIAHSFDNFLERQLENVRHDDQPKYREAAIFLIDLFLFNTSLWQGKILYSRNPESLEDEGLITFRLLERVASFLSDTHNLTTERENKLLEIDPAVLDREAVMYMFYHDLLPEKTIQLLSRDTKLRTKKFHILYNDSIDILIKDHDTDGLTDKNWKAVLSAFFMLHQKDEPDNPNSKKIKEIFNDPKNILICFEKVKTMWTDALENSKKTGILQLPLDLNVLVDFFIAKNEGTHLRSIESLGKLIKKMNDDVSDPAAKQRLTKEQVQALSQQLLSAEQAFKNYKIPIDVQAKFYYHSADIYETSPELFGIVLNFLSQNHFTKNHAKQEIERFINKDYGQFHAALMLIQTEEQDPYQREQIAKEDRDLLSQIFTEFAQNLQLAKENKGKREHAYEIQHTAILEIIKRRFSKKFEMHNLPDRLGDEEIRTIKNFSRYFANLSQRNKEKEAVLSYIFALMLNKKWDAFLKGDPIQPEDFFSGERLERIQSYIEKRTALQERFFETFPQIAPIDRQKFLEILQRDTVERTSRSIETTDVAITTLAKYMKDFTDPDLYKALSEHGNNPYDFFKLIQTHGARKVNGVIAAMFQSIQRREDKVDNEDKGLSQKILDIFGLETYNESDIRKIQQLGAFIGGVMSANTIADEASKEVERLHALLIPQGPIAELLSKIGEPIANGSGIIPISQDVDYLEKILITKNGELTIEESTKLRQHLIHVRSQLAALDEYYETLSDAAKSVVKQAKSYPHMDSLVHDVETALERKDDNSRHILATVTTDMNVVVENIRQCLGCLTAQINNDTNLSFADGFKLYIMSQESISQPSVSDELAFVTVTTNASGEEELTFVMDNVYGVRSGNILLAHTLALHKKMEELKAAFPQLTVSIIVSDAALKSAGVTEEKFQKELAAHFENEHATFRPITRVENATTHLAQPAIGDHYTEYSNKWGRESGDLPVSGLQIH